jgi:hypothetical protein
MQRCVAHLAPSCHTFADAQRCCSRPFSKSAQCRRTGPRGRQSRSQQSRVRRYFAACRAHGRGTHCRSAFSVPRLHHLDCLRFAPDRTTSPPDAGGSARSHRAISLSIPRRTPARNIPRRGACRRRSWRNVAKYCREIPLANRCARLRGASFPDRSNSRRSPLHL